MGTPTLVCVWSCPDFSAPAGRPFRFYAAEILLALEYENGFHKRFKKYMVPQATSSAKLTRSFLIYLVVVFRCMSLNNFLLFDPFLEALTATEAGGTSFMSSVSSSDPGTSPFFLPDEGSSKISELDLNTSHSDVQFRGNVRDAISLPRNTPSGSSPLCSICQHKAPIFGKPPRWFSFVELELATNRFSQDNFLATQRDTSRWTFERLL
ncbi:hypothetical protein Tco_0046170 [Tanacetum coccineum]